MGGALSFSLSRKPLFAKDLISGVAASGQSASYWLLAGKSWMYVSAWKPLAESGRKHPLCREDLDGQCREVVFYRSVDTEHVAWVLQLLCGKVLGRKIYSNAMMN